MVTNPRHIPTSMFRSAFAFVAVLLVLVSTCEVKTSIRSLTGLTKTERAAGKGNYGFFGNSAERCVNTDVENNHVAGSDLIVKGDLQPASLLAAFDFIFSNIAETKGYQSRFYFLVASNSVPIFIRLRKLII